MISVSSGKLVGSDMEPKSRWINGKSNSSKHAKADCFLAAGFCAFSVLK